MSGILAHNSGSEADFQAIELAVMETERGRWFLSAFAARNRHADTQVLLTALSRIHFRPSRTNRDRPVSPRCHGDVEGDCPDAG
jgi:hypothetical protein